MLRRWGGGGRSGFGEMVDVITVISGGGVLVFGMFAFGHFTEEFCEFVFVLAHV